MNRVKYERLINVDSFNNDLDIKLFFRNSLVSWRNKSIEECNEKCVITGEKYDVVHHLHPFNLILNEVFANIKIEKKYYVKDYTSEELMTLRRELKRLHFDVYGLGVCLTDKIHKEFHNLMGLNAKTKDFEIYKEYKLKNKDLNEIRKVDSSREIMNENILIYESELRELINARNRNNRCVLFSMLLHSKSLNATNKEFYMTYKQMSKMTDLGSKHLMHNVNKLIDDDMLEATSRNGTFKFNRKPPNRYLFKVFKEKSGKVYEFNIEKINDSEYLFNFLDLIISDCIELKLLKEKLPDRQYLMLRKLKLNNNLHTTSCQYQN